MRFKYKVKEAGNFLAFAFYPRTTLLACVVLSGIIIAILGIMLVTIPQDSDWYDIVFALTTGAIGSFFVSFIIELTSNYKHNKLAWYELEEYYSTVMEYESHKQIMMKKVAHQRKNDKSIALDDTEELDEDDEAKDIIQITWKQLPDVIPVFKQTYNDKKEFLSDKEIHALKYILSDYERIENVVRMRIMTSPMEYDALNHPDEKFLNSIYPSDVIKNMPEWIRKELASRESQKACERYAEKILSDSFLLSNFMEDYNISQSGIDNYETDKVKNEEEMNLEECDMDVFGVPEPEDEETFRVQNEKFSKSMELRSRPFDSWNLSTCCRDISMEIDTLEKCIQKKPYYGIMMESFKKITKEEL